MLRFNKKIYPKGAIEQAMKDYRRAAESRMAEKGKYFLVDLKPKEKDATFEDEFKNYVLSLGQVFDNA